jgi:hypothetical protein
LKRDFKIDKYLLIVFILCFIIYFFFSFHAAGLFFFGAIWRWSQDQCEKHERLQSRKYKYSFINIFYKMNKLIQKMKPTMLAIILTTLTPVLFILILSLIIGSTIPYWFVLLGSLSYDVPQVSNFLGRDFRPNSKSNL